ncbi:MAG: DUF4253 domain-containing protein [Planctomycetes bacterium]|nr:DUF4253 domain-containing protein [Planctomycetota bacterium]
MPLNLNDFLLLFAVGAGAVLLLAVLLRSVREGMDSLPHGETLDPGDLKETGLDEGILKILREESGEPAIFEGTKKRTGLAVLPDGASAHAALARLRERLKGRATAFLCEDKVAAGVPACIVVLAGADPWQPLGFMGTRQGAEVAERLREWRGRHAFELTGCGDDWVELWFPAPVEDEAFFRDVWNFCPRAAADSEGGAKALMEKVRKEGLMYLWWESESERAERRGMRAEGRQPRGAEPD